MRLTRIYVNSVLQENSDIVLNLDTTHRLKNVLRLHPKDRIIVFNGKGGEYEGIIQTFESKTTQIWVGRFNAINRESAIKIHLVQSIPKAFKMDYILQKAVELGVTSITPLLTQQGTVQFNPKEHTIKAQRWHDLIIAACEQSGQNILPLLRPIQTLEKWLHTWQDPYPYLLLHPEGKNTLKNVPRSSELFVLIGPEGGWHPTEIHLILEKGGVAINLGPRILRTETASIAALAALQALWGT